MSNSWADLTTMLVRRNRWIGKIVSIDTITGKITVDIPESNVIESIIINGDGSDTYAINDYVFIENGTIESKAPPLRAVVNETVY